ncbi:extracellular solute-binding protein [Arthrobacter sp. zg-Y20]|uniref:extracellular solute-binding protein n=1 Tax=unclassified Arthrobacter TaxID=235627 RepID=UPI001D14DD85|nr:MULTISPECIES: extracellular solute-binding protein [unclassified Arthrobacter]MCC3275670.1 extracellular solute-binding protein [Arthrobacter sp. zg-Y20]MDK1315827.1 extracellular solute-binding protein [Arthrobacter sp. zg.Y20]WIB06228.1 extracellular solute-binding protein [Arthrobacter sp. zg-Y20]
MKIARTAAVAALSLTMALSACAPPTSDNAAANEDQDTGTIRVWLFSEVNQDPKSAVVDAAVEEFEAAHEGAEVDVQYIPVDTRAERFKAAFNDPSSAPDVAEFGNTDLASYVASGGLADITSDIEQWEEGQDLDEKVLATTEIDGKNYGVPWFVGVRALYYRTDILDQLGAEVPKTLAEVEETARAARAANPQMLGISVGGAAQFAAMPYLWAAGGSIADEEESGFVSGLDSPASREGVSAYTRLMQDDICPPQTCAEFGGNASVQQFIAGNAAMTIGGDFNYKAVAESAVKDNFAVVPLPGTTEGSIAPAFAGGNNLGVFNSSEHRTLATDFVQLLASKKYQQQMFDAMGNLPTFSDVQKDVADAHPEVAPFIATLEAGTNFVPVTDTWSTIDAQGVFTGMYQKIVTGKSDVETATKEAADAMNQAFGSK